MVSSAIMKIHCLKMFSIYPLLRFCKCLSSAFRIFLVLFSGGKGGSSITVAQLVDHRTHDLDWADQASLG